MKKISLALALCCASFYSMADQLPLGGFSYGPMEAPTGKEWESPENLALNKEQPHAYIFPFQDVESARKVLPENSKFWQSLDGDWKFNWAPDPDSRPKDFYKTEFDVSGWDNIPVPSSWNIYGVQKDGSLKYGVPIYVNQPVIFQHKVAVDDWRGGVMLLRQQTGRLTSTGMKSVLSVVISRYRRIGTDAKFLSVSMESILSFISGSTVNMSVFPKTPAIRLISTSLLTSVKGRMWWPLKYIAVPTVLFGSAGYVPPAGYLPDGRSVFGSESVCARFGGDSGFGCDLYGWFAGNLGRCMQLG